MFKNKQPNNVREIYIQHDYNYITIMQIEN